MLRIISKTWAAPIFMAFLVLFAMQATAEQMEHAGLIECCVADSQALSSDNASSDPSPSCNACYCDGVFAISFHRISLTRLDYSKGSFFAANVLCADGPVKKIDHPPQLS